MRKIEEGQIETQRAIEIANKLLEVYKFSFNHMPIILTSHICNNEEINEEREKQDFYRRIIISDRHSERIECRKKEKESDLWEEHNTYYIHYQKHDYQIKFYDCPERCNYASYGYNHKTDMFCNIQLINAKNEKVYDMDFTFNVETMKFLDLYCLQSVHERKERHFNKDSRKLEEVEIILIKRCYNKKLEENFRGRILVDVHEIANIRFHRSLDYIKKCIGKVAERKIYERDKKTESQMLKDIIYLRDLYDAGYLNKISQRKSFKVPYK